MTIRIMPFDDNTHFLQVVDLWKRLFGYGTLHNDPELMIEKKLNVDDGLFFVAIDGEELVGTIMAGYDGHRGWIYSMAVLPRRQKKGIGQELIKYAEGRLESLGCVKINLQVIEGNDSAQKFFEKQGYRKEKRISMGKIIKVDRRK